MKNISEYCNEAITDATSKNNETAETILESGTWSKSHYRLLTVIDGIEIITQSTNSNNNLGDGPLSDAQLKEVTSVVKAYKKLNKELVRPYLEVFAHDWSFNYYLDVFKVYWSNKHNKWQIGETFDIDAMRKIGPMLEKTLVSKSNDREEVTFELTKETFPFDTLKRSMPGLK